MEPPVDSRSVTQAMRGCDLVAIPSQLLETGPLVVYEAFAAGVPVIGSRLGGIAELVTDGIDGLLVEADDPDAWSAAISSLAAGRGTVARLLASPPASPPPPRNRDSIPRAPAARCGPRTARW